MNFFKNLFLVIFLFFTAISIATGTDTATGNEKLKKQVEDIAKEINKEIKQDEEVPLNDPFAGNEGNNRRGQASDDDGEEQDVMSLYNFKLVGLISGADHSYIALSNSSGEVIVLTICQHLGKIKLIDLRLTEAIFEKDDKSFIIIDFNNQIREANEY